MSGFGTPTTNLSDNVHICDSKWYQHLKKGFIKLGMILSWSPDHTHYREPARSPLPMLVKDVAYDYAQENWLAFQLGCSLGLLLYLFIIPHLQQEIHHIPAVFGLACFRNMPSHPHPACMACTETPCDIQTPQHFSNICSWWLKCTHCCVSIFTMADLL